MPLTAAPFAVELVLAEGAESDEPFLSTDDGGTAARTYLALLRSETGATLDRLVLSLPAAATTDEEAPTNAELDARWESARGDLQRLQGCARYFPELVLPATGAEAALPPRLPPLLYCPVPRRFFPYPCPTCLRPLHTCRDDSQLAAARLPLYTTTSIRFLYCSACAVDDQAGQFFQDADKLPRALARKKVRRLEELRAGLAEALDRLAEGRKKPPEDVLLPCASCPEAGPCLGTRQSGKATDGAEDAPKKAAAPYWHCFNGHEAPYLLTRLYPFSFDRFVDLLGGRPQETAQPTGSGRLFPTDGSGIDAVETLALKLSLFLQITRAVGEYHRRLSLPHLDLHPGRIRIERREGDDLPHLWGFQAKLLGSSSARLLRVGSQAQILLPPSPPRVPFCSPRVQAAHMIQPQTAELIVDKLEEEKGTGNKKLWRLVGQLEDPNGVFPAPRPGDWFSLGSSKGPLASAACYARTVAGDGSPGSLPVIETEPLALSAAQSRALAEKPGQRLGNLDYRLYPALGIEEDLFSLGVLLLRTLLVNDRQDLSAVSELVAAVPQRGARERRAREVGWERAAAAAFTSVLAEHPESLAKTNIFFQQADRDSERPNSIPEPLWRESLWLAFSLLAMGSVPSAPDAEKPDERPAEASLEGVSQTLQDLLRRLHQILFQRQSVHLEIRSVISEMLSSAVELQD